MVFIKLTDYFKFIAHMVAKVIRTIQKVMVKNEKRTCKILSKA